MKKQVARLSPHQNGKVFAILMTVGSLVFVLPFMLFGIAAAPKGSGPPFLMVVIFPIFYLVFGYLSVAVGCWLYNTLFKYIGGIEYESRET
ncbi:hypothetical protein [Aquabacterium humicola]|uniref:hypothetical protein n=1 Tax=Aquabacterium humicola TaxID=3237377 RepID=UPI002543DE1F|nr:hypothetical protein [Rubrivivax pictus]